MQVSSVGRQCQHLTGILGTVSLNRTFSYCLSFQCFCLCFLFVGDIQTIASLPVIMSFYMTRVLDWCLPFCFQYFSDSCLRFITFTMSKALIYFYIFTSNIFHPFIPLLLRVESPLLSKDVVDLYKFSQVTIKLFILSWLNVILLFS